MIVVLCANPALDVTYRVEGFTAGETHRVEVIGRRAGGKGINVARVLRALGHEPLLVAPLGGPAGAEIGAQLSGVLRVNTVGVPATTRTSVTLLETGVDGATVFNEPGPVLDEASWRAVETATLDAVVAGDVLVLSGSLPPGPSTDAYARLTRAAHDRGARVVVDTSGEPLRDVLGARPDVVAPNVREAGSVSGRPDVSAEQAATGLCDLGARFAVVSDGPRGLTATDGRDMWRVAPDRPLTGNPTGAGDALTAVLAAGLAGSVASVGSVEDLDAVLRDAVAVSAASVACAVAGSFDPELRAELREMVSVRHSAVIR